MIVNNFTDEEMVDYAQETANGKWHFFVLSWERNGNTRIFVDSISIVEKLTLTLEQLPKM